jgi:spore coat polysaccharide biosynthesis protein SpsF
MEKKSVGCIVQARMGSSRLPKKVMSIIYENKTVLDCVTDQLSYSKLIDNLVVATTSKKIDDPIENHLQKNGISCFRGNENDVLDRHYQCAKKYNFETIVRIPADRPIIDPLFVDKVIQKFLESDIDYISTFHPPSFPLGGDVEIFNFSSLENAWKNASLASEREHVTPYLYNTKKFKVMNYGNKKNQSNIRYVVDRNEDLLLVKKIFSKISKRPILMQDILQLFDQEKSLFEINKNIDRDEGYKKSLKEDAKAHDVCEK